MTRHFAILPAAGHSRRMGAAKLLLPLGEATVIDRVLASWRQSAVDHVLVVVRQADQLLAARCTAAGVLVVQPDRDPPDMKSSVAEGLAVLARRFGPEPQDRWLLSPADTPRLSTELIDHVREAAHKTICVPVFNGRRGHPVSFAWSLADEVSALGPNQGVNALLCSHPVQEVPWSTDADWQDLDTPSDYRRFRE